MKPTSSSAPRAPALRLAHGLAFADLYRREGLVALDRAYLAALRKEDAALADRLLAARANPGALAIKDESALLIDLGPHLDRFLGELFGITAELDALRARHAELDFVYEVKRQFVQRRAATKIKAETAKGFDLDALEAELAPLLGARTPIDEHTYAKRVHAWLADETANARELDLAARYAAAALHTPAGRARHEDGILFQVPRKTDHHNLVQHGTKDETNGVTTFTIKPGHLRRREGFALTDHGMDLERALDQANYCILCHNQGKDSCRTGLVEKPPADQPGKLVFKASPFGVTLAGCPLEEKISEFHTLKQRGVAVGALAVICVDNPLAAATGHRICNDCMKSCIYQKQQPVDIPQIETRTLKDVLGLPWGFEVYSLLTRWNPLNVRRPLPLAPTGYKVLVVGMGPAGFSLAHHLMNDGHAVVGIDGLKIEPLPARLAGVAKDGSRVPFEPIHSMDELKEPLAGRVMAGFGGVAEYGITVRWDKNFLKVVRLLLERRAELAMYGGVRFGSTVTLDDALGPVASGGMGFDHVALCMGAGRPTTLDIPNGLARGVRTASDFLMALQLTGAAKDDSIANMQVRLPVVVIGGGLTAIDTATESLAYYAVQVEKFLTRYETLVALSGEDAVRARWDAEERELATEFLAHARALRAERKIAKAEGRAARTQELLQGWGGVTIAYRRRLIDAPSYTLNHEEVEKALEEGISFCECLSPLAVDTDARGAVAGIRFAIQRLGADGKTWSQAGEHRLAARSIFVAAGTSPNTVLAREDPHNFVLEGKYFRTCDETGAPVKPQYSSAKPSRVDVLMSRMGDGRFASFFGDLHPSYFGNVVKALGSTKQGYPVISRVLATRPPAVSTPIGAFFTALDDDLRARVHEVIRLTPNIVEVVVKAPRAARQFRPGQFYRLQNYEALSPVAKGTRMQMEGLALTGAWVDPTRGLVSTIVLEMGGSSSLVAMLERGEPIVLMGPTGSPTHVEPGEQVVLVGGGLGNAVLFSIGQAIRAAGSRVLYFAGYKKIIDRYKVPDIEAAADVVVWCCDEAPGFVPGRPGDKTFVGNIVAAMEAYASGKLGTPPLAMKCSNRLIAIGSDRMMAAVAAARKTVLAPHLEPGHAALGSINSPMQCMMKEICAQCLQPHKDPATGKTSTVFSCFNQDQPLDKVDWPALNERLRQNSLAEKLTASWIAHCMSELKAQRSLV